MISNFTDVQILGDFVPMEFKTLIKGKIPEQYDRTGIFIKYTYVNPAIVNSKCINCGKCVDLCPEKAIRIKSSFMNKFIQAMRHSLDI